MGRAEWICKAEKAVIYLNKVNKIKEDMINYVVKTAEESKLDVVIYLFGSAIRDDCTEDSDIDLAIDTDLDICDSRLVMLYRNIRRACDRNCDVIYFPVVSDGAFRDNILKGIRIYG